MSTHYIEKDAVRAILSSLGGRFVTIDAIKKDGNPTRHNGQLCAEGPASHEQHSQLFTIKKSNQKGFRSFKDTSVTRIAGNGEVYAVKSSLAAAI